ncbi:MAG TPA: PP2C family protein-serine/threonine phosphatase [Candidatus Elarobacter sp.]
MVTEAVVAAARDGDATLLASLFATMARELDDERIRVEAEKKVTEQLYQAFQQQLPVLPSLGFSATYVPASTGAIGGDWYDAFELPDGRILFSIGDVAGHGVEAAVAMGRARQAILAIALGATDPGEVFERANLTMMLQDTHFATAICGYVDPATLRVTYASAGHPPGIIVGVDRIARHLDYGGLPLGVAHDAEYHSFEVQAEHGALLVLYTDGLLEYDRDLLAGERRILEAVSTIASRRIDNPAAAIRDAIFARYEPSDDVAIMTIAFAQHPSDQTAEGEPLWSVGVRGVRAPLASRGPTRVDARVDPAGRTPSA